MKGWGSVETWRQGWPGKACGTHNLAVLVKQRDCIGQKHIRGSAAWLPCWREEELHRRPSRGAKAQEGVRPGVGLGGKEDCRAENGTGATPGGPELLHLQQWWQHISWCASARPKHIQRMHQTDSVNPDGGAVFRRRKPMARRKREHLYFLCWVFFPHLRMTVAQSF